jgi:hypothetical protein
MAERNQSQQNPLVTLLVLLALLAVAGGVFFGLWRGLAALNSTTAAAVITASATVLFSVLSLIVSKRWEQRLAIAEAQREHKRGVYQEFMRFWFQVLSAPMLDEQPPDEKEIQRFSVDFNQQLILWGSDDLLSEYNRFRAVGAVLGEEGGPPIMFAFEGLLYAIRRDLGHPNKGLGRGDLLRVFINDLDDFVEPKAQTE